MKDNCLSRFVLALGMTAFAVGCGESGESTHSGGSNAGGGDQAAGAGGSAQESIEPGTHFELEPSNWTVPKHAPGDEGYHKIAGHGWTTLDLHGDGKPDLVVYDATTNFNRKWLIYENTGSGFSEEPAVWTVPKGASDGDGYNNVFGFGWTTLDLHGDGKPDLVVFDATTNYNRKWLIYENTGSGFSEEPAVWTVPKGASDGDGYNNVFGFGWTTLDLHGDGKPDLVVYDDTTEFNRKWLVYENTGSGFSEEPDVWTLPKKAPGDDGYSALASYEWSVFDLQGDGRPDLVVSGNASELNRKWLLYPNMP